MSYNVCGLRGGPGVGCSARAHANDGGGWSTTGDGTGKRTRLPVLSRGWGEWAPSAERRSA